jgi:hypothetical protein
MPLDGAASRGVEAGNAFGLALGAIHARCTFIARAERADRVATESAPRAEPPRVRAGVGCAAAKVRWQCERFGAELAATG